jgi:hypothetical protein
MRKQKNEKSLRASFNKNRGKMDGWTTKPTPAKVKKNGGIIFSLRFSSVELAALRKRAEALNTSLSGLIRTALFEGGTSQSAQVYSIGFTSRPILSNFGETTYGTAIKTGLTIGGAGNGGHTTSRSDDSKSTLVDLSQTGGVMIASSAAERRVTGK